MATRQMSLGQTVRAACSVCRATVIALLVGCGTKSDATPAQHATTDFNADSAMSYLRQQVAFGPRIPGTDAAKKCGDWMVSRLQGTADVVVEQNWTYTTSKGVKLPLRNILARFKPNATQRILYVTHWDTRPFADADPVLANRTKPFDGANDGASGVGLQMAIADELKKAPPTYGVDLLFVDGEDWGTFGPPDVDVLIGSTYFAQHLPSPDYNPLFGVLWDMIGDADLTIYQEINSANRAPEVVQRVWSKAKDMGYESVFVPTAKEMITDDHIPLLNAGLRVIDVIDLDYPNAESVRNGVSYHHAVADQVDKVSVKSLKIVGDVALALLH